jgi:hypothetical protein
MKIDKLLLEFLEEFIASKKNQTKTIKHEDMKDEQHDAEENKEPLPPQER